MSLTGILTSNNTYKFLLGCHICGRGRFHGASVQTILVSHSLIKLLHWELCLAEVNHTKIMKDLDLHL